MRTVVAVVSALLVVLGTSSLASAQPWPSKPIRIIVGFPPGGAVDILARTLGRAMATELGQPVVIENKAGAAQTLGVEALASASPDGYTIGVVDSGPLTISPHLRRLSYDPFKAIVPIGSVVNLPLAILASKTTGLTNLRDVEETAKKSPGTLTYGSAGPGSIHNLIGESLKIAKHLDIIHVPYKGMAAAIPDLLEGRISLMLTTAATGGTLVRENQVRAIAVTSLKRSAALPDTPSLDEQGVPGFDAQGWVGLFAPAGISPQVLSMLEVALRKSLRDPDLVEQEVNRGKNELLQGKPDELAAMLQRDYTRWGQLIRDQGIRGE